MPAAMVAAEDEDSVLCVSMPKNEIPVLYRFVENGYVSDRDEIVQKRLRKYYHLEDAGRAYFDALLAEYKKISAGVQKMLGGDSVDESAKTIL